MMNYSRGVRCTGGFFGKFSLNWLLDTRNKALEDSIVLQYVQFPSGQSRYSADEK